MSYKAEISIDAEKLKEILLEYFNDKTGLNLDEVDFLISESDGTYRIIQVKIYKRKEWDCCY